jgi:hypothetical protein
MTFRTAQLTFLSVSLSHTLAAAASTLNSSEDAIHIRGSAPFLVGKDVDSQLLFAGLDEPHIGEHAFIFESAREFGGQRGTRVQPGEGDQLKDKSDGC